MPLHGLHCAKQQIRSACRQPIEIRVNLVHMAVNTLAPAYAHRAAVNAIYLTQILPTSKIFSIHGAIQSQLLVELRLLPNPKPRNYG